MYATRLALPKTGGGKSLNIRLLYTIPASAKIVVCIGNICNRKNQKQIVRAFDLLPDQVAKDVWVLFVGGEIEQEYNLRSQIELSKRPDHLVACGAVNKELVGYYYNQSDAVALMSISEGFGLSLIEGLHFGLPCMAFTDIDAYADIYDESVMIGVDGHADENVAAGLKQLLTRNWDKQRIKEYSKKFESQTMAQNYVRIYTKQV